VGEVAQYRLPRRAAEGLGHDHPGRHRRARDAASGARSCRYLEWRSVSSRKAGSGPICQAGTRYRFTDKDGEGWGSVTSAAACRHRPAATAPQVGPPHRLPRGRPHPRRPPTRQRLCPAKRPDDRKRNDILKLFGGTSRRVGGRDWLTRKGLGVSSAALFGRRRRALYDEGRLIGHVPAVIAPITAPTGEMVRRAAALRCRGPQEDHAARRHHQRCGGPAA
jgi:hypothetical protein